MIWSKRVRWIMLTVVVVLFIGFSIYRYQVVNKPYKDYTIIEKAIKQDEPMEINGVEMTFGTPQLIEYDEQYAYEIPLTVVNNQSEFIQLEYDDFKIIFNDFSFNGLAYEEINNHPENHKEYFAFNGVAPQEEGHAQLVFNLMKDWEVNEKTDVDLYYVTFSDNIVTKYKYPLNKP